jgi:hypothetical protein
VTAEHDAEASANLYREEAEYVAANWKPGRLEARSKQPHSSQSLCVSLLITLRQRGANRRNSVVTAIAERGGLALPATSSP